MIHHIKQLLDKVGNDREVLKWIREFCSYNGIFAVLKIGGASLQDFSSPLCEDLAILSKLDLIPPVVYGWGDAYTRNLKQHGITTLKHEQTGVRITRKEDLPFLEEVANNQGNILVDELRSRGIAAEIVYNVFLATKKELQGISFEHYTGDVVGVDAKRILLLLQRGVTPIVPPLGCTREGQLMNINGDLAAKCLVLSLNPKKYIMITNAGGVLNNQGKIVSEVSIGRDYDKLIETGIVSGGMKLKIDEARDTLRHSTKSLEIQIAHPNNLLCELFTDRGKGTYFRR